MIEKPADSHILTDLPTDVDALDFTPYVRTLANVIRSPNTATPLTIGVFGTWGSGKTSLMRMVQKQLPDDFQTVWFDAWKYDKEEALWRALLLHVLSAVRNIVEAQEPKGKEAEEARESALNALSDLEASLYRAVEREELGNLQVNWKELLKGSVETALHVGIALVPGLRIAQAVMEGAGKKATSDDPGTLLKAVERAKTKIYSEQVQSLEQFQQKFQWLVGKYVQPPGKLVVFVDDLDRCMPEKAIEVLEAIKLFLDVEGCVFVLGLDQDVVARGVELKYRELGLVEEGDEKKRFVIDGTRYLEKIIQLPFQIPPIERQDMASFVEGLVQDWPHEDCSKVFAEGLGDNPRQVKRTVNVFLLLWGLAQERAEKLQGRVKPVRLAKVVAIQNVYVELYEVLKRTPRLLRELEDYYRAEATAPKRGEQPAEGEPAIEIQRVEPPPVLAPYVNRASVRRILTMHPPETRDANFRGLTPEELRLYFTLTRRAEAPQVAPTELPRQVFEPQLPQLVRVPAGSFLMGSSDVQIEQAIQAGLGKTTAGRERPQRELELPAYQIGRYLVTNAEYQVFVKETGHTPPRYWDRENYPEEKGDHPVVDVSWHDAMAYCKWLTEKTGKAYTLPSEAEWEKAARGEDGRIYPWGEAFDPEKCNTNESGLGDTTPVGQYSPNGDSPCGCVDMAGNVWEWTRSILRDYPYVSEDGREDLEASGERVLRGGSWSHNQYFARCAVRYRLFPVDWFNLIGFRVVVSPSDAGI
jgi:formylglycine-generating enzyme required for sulfatase activity